MCLSNDGDALSSLLINHVLELSHNVRFINERPEKNNDLQLLCAAVASWSCQLSWKVNGCYIQQQQEYAWFMAGNGNTVPKGENKIHKVFEVPYIFCSA